MGFDFDLTSTTQGLRFANLFHQSGVVKKVRGPIVEGTLPGATIGSTCALVLGPDHEIEAEVVGFKDRIALLMPLKMVEGITMGTRIERRFGVDKVCPGNWMLGQLLDGNAKSMNKVEGDQPTGLGRPIRREALSPLERGQIHKRILSGVRALDFCCPIGEGQRLGIMAASGVGKSVLMGMIARQSSADVNVIALIGERGREVTEFVERDLGAEGMKNTVVVAVTSDQSPVLKIRGANVATAIAEHFRDEGKSVLLMMDSVTRFAMAQREIGLASGEPPTGKGYTPSVFAQLPRLLERPGIKKGSGSITGLFTVLVEGNDFDDPVADAVRSVVDGHIVLSRDLAEKNHYPAIDVLASVSRLAPNILNEEELTLNREIRRHLSCYKDAEDLINIGGYRKGGNPVWDESIEKYPHLVDFLKQDLGDSANYEDAYNQLKGILHAPV